MKLFLKKGSGAQELVQRLLKTATSECDNPDIRDRAYVYWRLLSASGQVAKSVVLSEKPPINANQQILSARLLDELVAQLGSLASVYHKPADSFVGKGKFGADAVQRRAIEYHAPLPPRTSITLFLFLRCWDVGTNVLGSKFRMRKRIPFRRNQMWRIFLIWILVGQQPPKIQRRHPR